MNRVLQRFVSETEAEFAGRLKTPRDLMQRKTSQDEFLDTAVLAGYSVADILHGRVAETDIDSEVIRAFHLQYPHVGGFVDFIRSHSLNDAALAGIVSGVKGKLFELEYVDWLNEGHLPSGAMAELAASPTQEGWDVVIKDSGGHVLDQIQLKATESMAYIKEAFAAHPEIDIVSTHEIFEHLDGSGLEGHVTVSDFSDGQLTEHVQDQIQAADMTPEFELPLLAFGIIALQSYRRYRKGQITAMDAVRGGVKRGWRSLLCRGAAYASILISHEPVLSLPVSVLTRTTFSRFDVQERFISLLDQYRLALRERAGRLLPTDSIGFGSSIHAPTGAALVPDFCQNVHVIEAGLTRFQDGTRPDAQPDGDLIYKCLQVVGSPREPM
jgi:hypothetical protein